MIPVVVVNKTDDSNDKYPFVELMGVKEYVVTPVLRHSNELYTTLTGLQFRTHFDHLMWNEPHST